MAAKSLEGKIDKLYKEANDLQSIDGQGSVIPIKNIEVLITHMIKEHYEWEEIKTIIGILKKGKWEDLVNIVKDTIN
jgi:hypothetical protein